MSNEDRSWKILKSTYLHKEPWCTLRVDHVKLPTGIEIPNYYVSEYPNWANIIAITKNGEFVMVRQYRHGLQKTCYELPAGVCDDTDANAMESAKRELLEETGYGNGKWEQFAVVSANPGTHTNLCYCFLATDVDKVTEQHLESTEDLQVVQLTLQQVKKLLLNDEIKQAMHTTPLWKYFAINGLIK